MSGIDRRSFFKIVATSGAAAAAGGCGNDVNELVGNIPEKLIPYVVPPDNIVPGVAASRRCAASARSAVAWWPRIAMAVSSSSREIPITP